MVYKDTYELVTGHVFPKGGQALMESRPALSPRTVGATLNGRAL